MEIERHAMGIGCRLAKAREEGDEGRARELRAQLIAMQQVKRYVLKRSERAYRTVYGKSRKASAPVCDLGEDGDADA